MTPLVRLQLKVETAVQNDANNLWDSPYSLYASALVRDRQIRRMTAGCIYLLTPWARESWVVSDVRPVVRWSLHAHQICCVFISSNLGLTSCCIAPMKTSYYIFDKQLHSLTCCHVGGALSWCSIYECLFNIWQTVLFLQISTGSALSRMMSNLRESSSTAIQSEDFQYCTECVNGGWTPRTVCNDQPGISRGPHQQCTQPSNLMTSQLQEYWLTICHLPGIQLRVVDSRRVMME